MPLPRQIPPGSHLRLDGDRLALRSPGRAPVPIASGRSARKRALALAPKLGLPLFDAATEQFLWVPWTRQNPSKAQERKAAWAALRSELAALRARERDARSTRKAELARTKVRCEKRREAVKAKCARERSSARATAADKLAATKKRRAEARDTYSWRRGRAAPRTWERAYSRSESDSLAEHNIPLELRATWRQHKRLFPLDRAPDDRAVLFMEWVSEHRDELAAERATAAERAPREWAKLERDYYAAGGAPF